MNIPADLARALQKAIDEYPEKNFPTATLTSATVSPYGDNFIVSFKAEYSDKPGPVIDTRIVKVKD